MAELAEAQLCCWGQRHNLRHLSVYSSSVHLMLPQGIDWIRTENLIDCLTAGEVLAVGLLNASLLSSLFEILLGLTACGFGTLLVSLGLLVEEAHIVVSHLL